MSSGLFLLEDVQIVQKAPYLITKCNIYLFYSYNRYTFTLYKTTKTDKMNAYMIKIKFVNPKFDATMDIFTAFTQGDAIEKARKAYGHEPIETIEAVLYQT